jgi:hypothetical protein
MNFRDGLLVVFLSIFRQEYPYEFFFAKKAKKDVYPQKMQVSGFLKEFRKFENPLLEKIQILAKGYDMLF